MAKQTILKKSEQETWINENWANTSLVHHWSSRNMGYSKFTNALDVKMGDASGCGYDRCGQAFGYALAEMFPAALQKMAQRWCKTHSYGDTYKSDDYYGLFYNPKTKYAWVDGACGMRSMTTILNKLGFSLQTGGSVSKGTNRGAEFFTIKPLTKHDRQWIK